MCGTLYVVIPCFNEEEIFESTAEKIKAEMTRLIEKGVIGGDSRVLFVNDGSTDGTWKMICENAERDRLFTGISLAHNSGEQNAYLAGMEQAVKYADVLITMDADLQDGTDAVEKMLYEYENGNEIVYGVRTSRNKEPFLTRVTSEAFYKLMSRAGTELVREHSQYRLMSRRAASELLKCGEKNIFIPALVPLLGFKHSIVCHERKPRENGKSHYNFKSLFYLAVRAMTSYSVKPIHLIGLLSALCFIAGIIGMVVFIVKCCLGDFSNTALIFSCLWLAVSAVLFALRILGEYIYDISLNAKNRPRYIIEESLLKKDE
ncbi:MAG: glycosyltransferase family 2 protein [Clostridiales bacterium]|nr:glycosyltransferase family 2 protein [Clostridiales bacterium]